MSKDISDKTKGMLPQFGVQVFNAQNQFPLTDSASMAGKSIGTHKMRPPVERSLNMEVKDNERSRDEYAPIFTKVFSLSTFPSADNNDRVAIKPENAKSANNAESEGRVDGNMGSAKPSLFFLFNHNMNKLVKARALSAAASSAARDTMKPEDLAKLSTKIRRPT